MPISAASTFALSNRATIFAVLSIGGRLIPPVICKTGAASLGLQASHQRVQPFALSYRRDANVDFHLCLIGDDVGARATTNHAHIHRCPFGRIIQLVQSQHLMRQLTNCTNPF